MTQTTDAPPGPSRLWVGTYPPDGPAGEPGRGEGVWRVALDPATGALTGELAAETPAPSFVALSADGRTLYAVGETAGGTVATFAVADDGALTPTGLVGSGGDHPCHLLLHPQGRALYVANYSSGTLGVLTLADDGGFSADVLAAGGPVQVLEGAGTGPVADRQEGPHTHSALWAPGDRFVLVADLGADRLLRYEVAPDGTLAARDDAVVLPPGTGPRHLAAGPEHLYLVGELDNAVHVLAWDPGAGLAEHLGSVPAATGPRRPGSTRLPAHVVLRDGEVLVSVRGDDVVVRLEVFDGGARLERRDEVPAGGSWPRHFAVVPGTQGPWLVVAGQESGVLTSITHDDDPRPAGELRLPYPACVVAG